MEQFGKDLEKILKAGIGAVSTGVEKGAEAIEKLAEKGEPIYQQAKDTVCQAAGKIKKAVDDSNIPENITMLFGGKCTAEAVIAALKHFSREELEKVQEAIVKLLADMQEECCPCACEDECMICDTQEDTEEKENE